MTSHDIDLDMVLTSGTRWSGRARRGCVPPARCCSPRCPTELYRCSPPARCAATAPSAGRHPPAASLLQHKSDHVTHSNSSVIALKCSKLGKSTENSYSGIFKKNQLCCSFLLLGISITFKPY